MSVVSATCYELLGVPVHAPRTEVARAWHDRRREALDAGRQRSVEEVEALCARLDEAYRTLVDPHRAQRYRIYVDQRRQAPALEQPVDGDGDGDPLRAPLGRPWERRGQDDLAEVIDAVLSSDSPELPDEDTINTLDEWSDGAPGATRGAIPQAMPAPPPSAFSANVTGRHKVISRTRPTTMPGRRRPAPWVKDD